MFICLLKSWCGWSCFRIYVVFSLRFCMDFLVAIHFIFRGFATFIIWFDFYVSQLIVKGRWFWFHKLSMFVFAFGLSVIMFLSCVGFTNVFFVTLLYMIQKSSFCFKFLLRILHLFVISICLFNSSFRFVSTDPMIHFDSFPGFSSFQSYCLFESFSGLILIGSFSFITLFLLSVCGCFCKS